MADHPTPDEADAAIQYLTWALEEIEKLDQPQAAWGASIALQELRRAYSGDGETAFTEKSPPAVDWREEAKRFRGKADEAEQLAELATTVSRRDALLRIAGNYRSTADQLERLPDTAPFPVVL